MNTLVCFSSLLLKKKCAKDALVRSSFSLQLDNLTFPQRGLHYVQFACPSLGMLDQTWSKNKENHYLLSGEYTITSVAVSCPGSQIRSFFFPPRTKVPQTGSCFVQKVTRRTKLGEPPPPWFLLILLMKSAHNSIIVLKGQSTYVLL